MEMKEVIDNMLVDKNYIVWYGDEKAVSEICTKHRIVDATGSASHSILNQTTDRRKVVGNHAHAWVSCIS